MSCGLLTALDAITDGPTAADFTFRHKLSHDFESLLWVVVYAMMIHHRNNIAPADKEKREEYKIVLDRCWAAHAYSNILIAHDHMMATGCSAHRQTTVTFWFPDPREAAFFRDVMRMLRRQDEAEFITYEGLRALFKKHIDLAKEPEAFDVVSK